MLTLIDSFDPRYDMRSSEGTPLYFSNPLSILAAPAAVLIRRLIS